MTTAGETTEVIGGGRGAAVATKVLPVGTTAGVIAVLGLTLVSNSGDGNKHGSLSKTASAREDRLDAISLVFAASFAAFFVGFFWIFSFGSFLGPFGVVTDPYPEDEGGGNSGYIGGLAWVKVSSDPDRPYRVRKRLRQRLVVSVGAVGGTGPRIEYKSS